MPRIHDEPTYSIFNYDLGFLVLCAITAIILVLMLLHVEFTINI